MSRMVPDMVNTEAKRIKCYIRGLPQKVRMLVRTSKPATLDSAVDLAQVVYADLAADELEVEDDEAEMKKRNPNLKPKEAEEENPRKKKARQEETTACEKCGRKHPGECRMGLGVCYRCGKAGHSSWECKDNHRCHNCGGREHLARDCRKPREERRTEGNA